MRKEDCTRPPHSAGESASIESVKVRLKGSLTREQEKRRLLAGGTPREILERLLVGDPLGLRTVVAESLRARHVLLDAEDVYLGALARVARDARRYAGRPALAAWLDGRVERAIDDAVRRDLARLRDGTPPHSDPRLEPHAEIGAPLGLEATATRAACARFNALDGEPRRAFFALFIDGLDIDTVARGDGCSASAVARRARRALLTLLGDAGGDGGDGGGDGGDGGDAARGKR
ncbi:MAG: hypothetical protein GY711_10590 [bacterium]|nr:hypothetical protein [bacterium]